jgi:hypothetical protein
MNRSQAVLTAAWAIASVALLGSPAALAQRAPARGMGAPPAPVPIATRRATPGVSRVSGARSGVRRSTGNASGSSVRHAAGDFGIGGGFPLSLQDLLNITPNSGFDWQFVNAVNQDLPIKAFIDPVTQIEVAQAERLFRSTRGAFSGAYILGGGGYYVPPEPEEGAQGPEQPQDGEGQPEQGSQRPQVIVLQQAPPQEAAQPSQPSGVEEQAAEQLPEEGEFTLVLRNGKQVEAMAFTRANDKIVYITPEGGRLTIPVTDLDSDETVRVNQERGTPLQLPL